MLHRLACLLVAALPLAPVAAASVHADQSPDQPQDADEVARAVEDLKAAFKKGEPGDRIRAIIADVKKVGHRVRIVLSRTHPDLIRRLFELEIPEIIHPFGETVERAGVDLMVKDRGEAKTGPGGEARHREAPSLVGEKEFRYV